MREFESPALDLHRGMHTDGRRCNALSDWRRSNHFYTVGIRQCVERYRTEKQYQANILSFVIIVKACVH